MTAVTADSKTLPTGFRVRLDEHTTVKNGGRTLIGGSPLRAMFLRDDVRWPVGQREHVVSSRRDASLFRLLLDRGLAHPALGDDQTDQPIESLMTAVVPVFQTARALDRLLDSIAGKYPVIVVDDHSPNGEAIARVCTKHSARLIRLPRNSGPSAARNAGLREATTPFVLCVDSDVQVTGQLSLLLGHFSDPKVAMVAPRVISKHPHERTGLISEYEKSHGAPDMGDQPALVSPLGKVGWLPAACLIARRDALGGGFDEQMRIAEDVDLVWSLIAQGWSVRYEPEVSVHHDDRITFRSWLSRRFAYGTGADDLAVRHGRQMTPALFSGWTLAVSITLLPARWWSTLCAFILATIPALRVMAKMPPSPEARGTAVMQPLRMIRGVSSQGSALLLRHWWPVTLVFSLKFRWARRLALAAIAVDSAESLIDRKRRLHHRGEVETWSGRWNPVWFLLMRRLDDLAYGAGVWTGAWRAGSMRSLLPRFKRDNSPPGS